MGIGMGLGAFVEGMDRGMAMRERMDARNERRANKKALSAIDTEAKTAYDEAVKSGDAQENSYDDFWMKYALPKRTAELMRQGEIDQARALKEWGESDAAKSGGKLFASALLKAQTGDAGGALDDAISAAKIKGYMDHGYELKSKDEIKDGDGNLVGYRLTVTNGEGEEFQQDVAPADVAKVVATFVNPEAAFQSQMDASAKKTAKDEEEKARQTKRGEEMSDYEAKKEIDKKYKDPAEDLKTFEEKELIKKRVAAPSADEEYQKAYKTQLENDITFAGKSPEEQDAIIKGVLERAKAFSGSATPGMGGAPAAGNGTDVTPPAPTVAPQVQQQQPAASAPQAPVTGGSKMIIDTVTGQPIQMNKQPVGMNQTAPAAVTPNPKDQVIESAIAEAQGGGDPVAVRKKLAEQGVSEDEFLAAMKTRARRLTPS